MFIVTGMTSPGRRAIWMLTGQLEPPLFWAPNERWIYQFTRDRSHSPCSTRLVLMWRRSSPQSINLAAGSCIYDLLRWKLYSTFFLENTIVTNCLNKIQSNCDMAWKSKFGSIFSFQVSKRKAFKEALYCGSLLVSNVELEMHYRTSSVYLPQIHFQTYL
jgi:hypothetical protein